MKADRWQKYSDVELVIAALVGNLQAFDELVMRYRSAMLSVAEPIVGTPQAAEDVVQDALLLAFKALPQLDDINRFASWLYAITRHRALRYLKEADRLKLRSDLDQFILEQSCAITPDPAQVYQQQNEQHLLREAIRGLAPEYQMVLRLYYWDGISQQRIAEFLGLPLTTVKWRLYKAKQMLREQLEKPGRGGNNHVHRTGNQQRNPASPAPIEKYREAGQRRFAHRCFGGRREKVH